MIGASPGGRPDFAILIRFEQLSNVGIKEPNPGINSTQRDSQYKL
jgi:hypothetical protein